MRKLCIALTMLSLAACEHEMPKELKPITFDGPAYRFNVSRIDVVDDYTPARQKKRNELQPDMSLGEAMHNWADTKLSAGGTANVLELHITSAEIVRNDLPKQKTGLEGMFTKEQTQEYNGKLTVELKLYTPERTLPVARAEVSAEQSHTLKENATVAERKAVYHRITAEIMKEVDKALDRNIHAYFANHLL